MPSSRKQTPDDKKYLKRRTFEQGKKEVDAAHTATQQLYCERVGSSGASAGCASANGIDTAAVSRPIV